MLMSWLADDSQLGESEQTTFDFQLTGEFELMDRFVGFAFTMEHQKQKYDLTPSAGRLDDDVVMMLLDLFKDLLLMVAALEQENQLVSSSHSQLTIN